ncbi:MAG: glycosyltransferase [Candidatus Cloacimonetes bacterium]|nr:glycosyltransferase [Candidatus Cloacimonadota bacterium]
MKVLMLTWEFPPLIAGGLGMACYGMVKSLLSLGVEIDLILPTKKAAYFPLRKVEDADILPVRFSDPVAQERYTIETRKLTIVEERLKFLGISERPETYINYQDLKDYKSLIQYGTEKFQPLQDLITSHFTETEYITTQEDLMFANIRDYLVGQEDIFRKVQEYTIRATQLAQTLDYDLIHSHDWLTYPAAMFIKKITGKPLVVHIHATEFDRAGGEGDERIHKIEFSGMSYADRVIAVSKYTAQMVMTRYRIDSGKLRIVHNAHITNVKKMKDPDQRLFKGPTILFLGRITIQKGPDYFLDVAKRVLEKHPRARFIMAGTGDMAKRLLHKSAFYRLKNGFLFTGFLNREEVENILSNTDIYMLPSVSEPFGIAPLEAMAYGIAAIISKQSGVSEVIKNAYKIDFWDIDQMSETICYLIENPDVREELGHKGMLEVEQIRWDTAAEHINTVYNETIR